jgi:hypothetical protein
MTNHLTSGNLNLTLSLMILAILTADLELEYLNRVHSGDDTLTAGTFLLVWWLMIFFSSQTNPRVTFGTHQMELYRLRSRHVAVDPPMQKRTWEMLVGGPGASLVPVRVGWGKRFQNWFWLGEKVV